MAEHLLFVTGKLAYKSLDRVLSSMEPRAFSYEIRVPGVSVAALLTVSLLKKRLGDVSAFSRVILPGRCRGDLADLGRHFGRPFERGPEELKDLPAYFGGRAKARDLSRSDVLIFAEIVDAPQLDVAAIVSRAQAYRADGADVIDIGCLPDVPFTHLEEALVTLKRDGFKVSVDSLVPSELARGIEAGADYVFSLTDETLDIIDGSDCIPILIPRMPGDMDSLHRVVDRARERGLAFYADPVLDPIHYGFTRSLARYADLRERYPDIAILMGIGNLSELTHCDSLGLNTLLLGVVSELGITGVLTTAVSPHCRSVIREVDHARRVLFAAREEHVPPRHIDECLLALHDRRPFPYNETEVADFARDVSDDNFRIQVSSEGMHIYNRHGLYSARDPYDLYPLLGVENDAPHAFYLGLELGRAQIAWQLGKRYAQDEELNWGCVVPRAPADTESFAPARSTLEARRHKRRR